MRFTGTMVNVHTYGHSSGYGYDFGCVDTYDNCSGDGCGCGYGYDHVNSESYP